MGWSIGYDSKWNRDIGYGVPAICDHPRCSEEIDRGLSYVCGAEQPYGGQNGCGLYFCPKHFHYHSFRGGDSGAFCARCIRHRAPYTAKPDVEEWVRFKLTDDSWSRWRQENADEVSAMESSIDGKPRLSRA